MYNQGEYITGGNDMYCPNCSAYIPEGADSCANCGQAVSLKNENHNATENQYSYTQPNPENNNNTANQYSYAQPNYEGGNSYGSYNAAPDNAGYQQNGYNSYYSEQPNQNNYFQQAQNDFKIKDALSTSNTLGILAIVLGFILTPLVGIICGVIGLSKANSVPDMFNNPSLMAEKKKAKKLNTLGIVLPLVCYVALFILIFVFVIIFMGTAGVFASIS